jgi:hypothetical protein
VAPATDGSTSAGRSLAERAMASAVPTGAVAGQAAGPGRQTAVTSDCRYDGPADARYVGDAASTAGRRAARVRPNEAPVRPHGTAAVCEIAGADRACRRRRHLRIVYANIAACAARAVRPATSPASVVDSTGLSCCSMSTSIHSISPLVRTLTSSTTGKSEPRRSSKSCGGTRPRG